MRRCTVNSSDLAYARVASHRLSTPQAELALLAGALGRQQDSVRRQVERSPEKAAPTGDDVDQGIADFVPTDIDSWEVLLAWSIELCRARAALVVDAQGFVIGSRGNAPASGFEGIGAELCFAMEQLDRIAPESGDLGALELHFGSTNILGIKVSSEKRGSFILGFVGSRGVHESVRDAVYKQATHNLDQLG